MYFNNRVVSFMEWPEADKIVDPVTRDPVDQFHFWARKIINYDFIVCLLWLVVIKAWISIGQTIPIHPNPKKQPISMVHNSGSGDTWRIRSICGKTSIYDQNFAHGVAYMLYSKAKRVPN